MQKAMMLAVVFILLGSATFGQTSYPEITLDDYYSHLVAEDTAHNFVITASKGLVLDPTQYDFTDIIELNDGKAPDLIHILSKNGTFIIELDINNKATIDKSTATNVSGRKKFKGFKKGDTPLLGIGTMKLEGETVQLMTYWVGMITVE